MNKKKIRFIVGGSLVLLILGGLAFALRAYWDVEAIKDFFDTIKNEPLLPLIYVVFYSVAVVFALPGTALTLLSGPLFGFYQGTLLVVIGANIGCNITFFISRFVAFDFVQKKLGKYEKMKDLSQKIEENGFSYMFYIRLLPIFPFNIINYLMGLTTISYKSYALASLLGMLPGIGFYVYLSTQVLNAHKGILNFIWPFALALGFFLVQRFIIKMKKID